MPWDALPGTAASAAAAAALVTAGLIASGRRWARRAGDLIAAILFYIAVPLIASYKVYSVPLETIAEYSVVVAASVLSAFGSAAVLIPRLLRGAPKETIGAAVLAAGIHNSAFLPIPLMLLLYGDGGPAALYSAIMNIIMAVATPLVLGVYSPVYRSEGKSVAASIARSIATYPPVYAIAAGAALRHAALPSLAVDAWRVGYEAGSYLTLLSFFLIGEVIARTGIRPDRGVGVVAFWRLVVEPAAATAAVTAVGLEGVWRAGAIIESFMPPATMNLVMAMLYKLDSGLVARSIGLITPISITLAVVYRLLNPSG